MFQQADKYKEEYECEFIGSSFTYGDFENMRLRIKNLEEELREKTIRLGEMIFKYAGLQSFEKDNIVLRKENKELKEENKRLKEENIELNTVYDRSELLDI